MYRIYLFVVRPEFIYYSLFQNKKGAIGASFYKMNFIILCYNRRE